MGLVKLEKGQVLHKAGKDIVETVEVIVKGSIKISNAFSSITLGVGGFVGIVETPGEPYVYNIEALEEGAVYSYPFNSKDDIPKVVMSNPKIAPILAAQSAEAAALCCDAFEQEYNETLTEYEKIKADYADYPNLCIKVGEVPKQFPELDELTPPERSVNLPEWAISFARSLRTHSASLKKTFYPLSLDIATGMVMTTYEIYQNISKESQALTVYRKALKQKTKEFQATMQMINAKLSNLDSGIIGGIAIVNALNTIINYAEVSPELAEKFEEQVNEFKSNENRNDSSDEARALRRSIASTFYDIYTAAFLKSLDDEDLPLEVQMFFMFGFVDEELAGDKYTMALANIARSYMPDPDDNVVLLYEWLVKIYNLEVEPSRNEFDQDWLTYLRDQKLSGDIREEQMEAMINDPEARLKFEIHNLFALGNRMTFGRISSFVPVFDSQNVLRPLDMAYQNTAKVNEYFRYIRSVDFGVFCRNALFSNVEIGVPQVHYQDDITPYMILMPNAGSRACLWQEIEGKKRSSKARMLVSIFNTENTEDCMIKLFGEFRWEMCKTEQGVHWNDVTDPSLTSMYCDYLQFFKKNSALSTEQKDKLRTDLKKYSNNYKNVFIADYLAYIKFESASSPRLNKVAREILFTFCPFAKELREKIADNPQYGELINHYNAHIGGQIKPLVNIVHRLQKEEIEVPEVILGQIEHLKK